MPGVLFGAIAVASAFWCLVALVTGLALGWPAIVLGCVAAATTACAAAGAVIFRTIRRQQRH